MVKVYRFTCMECKTQFEEFVEETNGEIDDFPVCPECSKENKKTLVVKDSIQCKCPKHLSWSTWAV